MKAKCAKVTDYWLDFYLSKEVGLCSICGNHGTFTTEPVSPVGVPLGKQKHFCICPNGQALRDLSK